jgi:hypothetical protein
MLVTVLTAELWAGRSNGLLNPVYNPEYLHGIPMNPGEDLVTSSG